MFLYNSLKPNNSEQNFLFCENDKRQERGVSQKKVPNTDNSMILISQSEVKKRECKNGGKITI